MSGGEIIFQGWLRKSPPEKKLRRYAWKKRWFILRSGRMSGDPDVLEYYKNDHSKKPIRVIDLHCCEQVDAGLTFKRKEFQDSFVFDIKTSDRTFYLVAETEDEMNKWVRSICQLCGFNQSDDAQESRLHHMPRSVGADVTGSMAPVSGERKSSAPIHSSQPVLFTFDVPVRHSHRGSLSNSAPQDYLLLHQCMSRKSESTRSASFSQSTRSNMLLESDSPVQKFSYGLSNCLNGTGAQLHGFYSLPKSRRHQLSVQDDSSQEACYVLPQGYSSEAPVHSNLGDPDFENEEVYTFKTPCNTLATMHSNERSPDNYDFPTTPGSFYQIPRTFDKNHNSVTPSSSESSCAPPPRPPKPNQGSEGNWGSPQSAGSQNGEMTSAVSALPRRNTLPAVENIRLHRGRQTPSNLLQPSSFSLLCFQIRVLIDQRYHSDSATFLVSLLHPSLPLSLTSLDLSGAAEQKQKAQCSRRCSTETLMKFKSYHLMLNVSFQTDKQLKKQKNKTRSLHNAWPFGL